MKSILINIFGGPGCGKSTLAAGLFAELKMRGVSAELIQEKAKELAWLTDDSPSKYSIQPLLHAEQLYRQAIVDGKVKYIITDSPALLSGVYDDTRGYGTDDFKKYAMQEHLRHPRINILMHRTVPYDESGRHEGAAEAILVDDAIFGLLRTMQEDALWYNPEGMRPAHLADIITS